MGDTQSGGGATGAPITVNYQPPDWRWLQSRDTSDLAKNIVQGTGDIDIGAIIESLQNLQTGPSAGVTERLSQPALTGTAADTLEEILTTGLPTDVTGIGEAARTEADRFWRDISAQINEQMVAGGKIGSSAQTGQLGQAGEDIATRIGEQVLRAGVAAQEAAANRRMGGLDPSLRARGLEYGAAGTLGGLELGGQGLNVDALSQAGKLGLGAREQGMQLASYLNELGLGSGAGMGAMGAQKVPGSGYGQTFGGGTVGGFGGLSVDPASNYLNTLTRMINSIGGSEIGPFQSGSGFGTDPTPFQRGLTSPAARGAAEAAGQAAFGTCGGKEGGRIPGQGEGDTFPILTEPGEVVLKKSTVADLLDQLTRPVTDDKAQYGGRIPTGQADLEKYRQFSGESVPTFSNPWDNPDSSASFLEYQGQGGSVPDPQTPEQKLQAALDRAIRMRDLWGAAAAERKNPYAAEQAGRAQEAVNNISQVASQYNEAKLRQQTAMAGLQHDATQGELQRTHERSSQESQQKWAKEQADLQRTHDKDMKKYEAELQRDPENLNPLDSLQYKLYQTAMGNPVGPGEPAPGIEQQQGAARMLGITERQYPAQMLQFMMESGDPTMMSRALSSLGDAAKVEINPFWERWFKSVWSITGLTEPVGDYSVTTPEAQLSPEEQLEQELLKALQQ